MTLPWNKHSSEWCPDWDDRWENRKIITISHTKENGDTYNEIVVGNPSRFTAANIIKIEDDMKATGGAALICIAFWISVAYLIVSFAG